MSALILRSISVEPLPHEDKGDEEQPDKAKPARRGGLFSRAKAAVTDNRVANARKLERALVELRKIEARRKQLMALDQAESEVAAELLSEYESKVPLYNRASSVDEFKKAYRAYLIATLETLPKTKWLRDHLGGLSRMSSINVGSNHVVLQLKGEYTNLKELLADCACLKAGQVKADAERIAKDEKKRLDDEYGAGEYEASETQVVKRARSNYEYIDAMVKRFHSEPVENLYMDVVRFLLQ